MTSSNLSELSSDNGSQETLTVFIFDDDPAYDYLEGIELPGIEFVRCGNFYDVEFYLAAVRAGERNPPAIMGIDVYCPTESDFEMFGVKEAVVADRCGYQLYESVLRRAGGAFASADVIFFTSFGPEVVDLSSRRLADQYGARIESCPTGEFRARFLNLAVDRGLISEKQLRELEFRDEGELDPTQDDYLALLWVVVAEFQFDMLETARFLGLVDDHLEEIEGLVTMSTAVNERIDLLLAISVLLDGILQSRDKRAYLEKLESRQFGGRSGLKLVLSGEVRALTAVKREIERRLGGKIL